MKPTPSSIRPKKTEEKIQQIPNKTERRPSPDSNINYQVCDTAQTSVGKEPDLLKETEQGKKRKKKKQKRGFVQKSVLQLGTAKEICSTILLAAVAS